MRLKFSLLAIVCLILSCAVQAQTDNGVKWTFSTAKTADKTFEFVATATVPKGWHIYSQTTEKGGPVPTKFTFKTNPLLVVTGSAKEKGTLKTVHDQFFDVDVKYYNDRVDFIQPVKLRTNATTNVSGTVEYMICNDEKCLPPVKEPFDVKLQ